MDNFNLKSFPCTNCQNTTFTILTNAFDFDTGTKSFAIEQCNHCLLVRTSPPISQSELNSYYDTAYYGSGARKFGGLIETWTIWSNNRLAKQILNAYQRNNSTISRQLKILDIGCGRGNLLKAFSRMGCECYGVERGDFPSDPNDKNISIYKSDLFDAPFCDKTFDVIIIWHVLEHLSNPKSVLQKVNRLLKVNGNLVLAVPNYGSLQSSLFGKYWFHLDLPRHLYHFTVGTLSSMASKCGFEINKITTGGIDQGIFGFIQSAINRINPDNPNQLYSMLKHSQQPIRKMGKLYQFTIATFLLPFAFIEYFYSTLISSRACIILHANNRSTEP